MLAAAVVALDKALFATQETAAQVVVGAAARILLVLAVLQGRQILAAAEAVAVAPLQVQVARAALVL